MKKADQLSSTRSRGRRVALLAMLYLVQGLPFGFQVSALPIFLREQGVGLAAIARPRRGPVGPEILWAPWWSGMDDGGAGCGGLCCFNFAWRPASWSHRCCTFRALEALMVSYCLNALAATRILRWMDWPSTSSCPPNLAWECGPGRGVQGRMLWPAGSGLGQRAAGLVGCLPGDGCTGDGGCADGDAGPDRLMRS